MYNLRWNALQNICHPFHQLCPLQGIQMITLQHPQITILVLSYTQWILLNHLCHKYVHDVNFAFILFISYLLVAIAIAIVWVSFFIWWKIETGSLCVYLLLWELATALKLRYLFSQVLFANTYCCKCKDFLWYIIVINNFYNFFLNFMYLFLTGGR